jgi:hypothetical protein
MDASTILDRLAVEQVEIRVVGDSLVASPASQVPPELVDEIFAHSEEIAALIPKGPTARVVFPDEPPGGAANIAEIRFQGVQHGYVLLWSSVLEDLVAFYGTDADLEKIPPGFVPYSLDELDKLFADENNEWSPDSLRLLHHAKKQGAVVTEVRREADDENRSS